MTRFITKNIIFANILVVSSLAGDECDEGGSEDGDEGVSISF